MWQWGIIINRSNITMKKSHLDTTCEYKKVPRMAIAAPRALTG